MKRTKPLSHDLTLSSPKIVRAAVTVASLLWLRYCSSVTVAWNSVVPVATCEGSASDETESAMALLAAAPANRSLSRTRELSGRVEALARLRMYSTVCARLVCDRTQYCLL